eukprot:2711856-Pyramimonas_sp.AAC.1
MSALAPRVMKAAKATSGGYARCAAAAVSTKSAWNEVRMLPRSGSLKMSRSSAFSFLSRMAGSAWPFTSRRTMGMALLWISTLERMAPRKTLG